MLLRRLSFSQCAPVFFPYCLSTPLTGCNCSHHPYYCFNFYCTFALTFSQCSLSSLWLPALCRFGSAKPLPNPQVYRFPPASLFHVKPMGTGFDYFARFQKGFYWVFSFSRHFPWDAWGGPEKDRFVCDVVWWQQLRFPSNASSQLDIFGHYGDSFGMDHAHRFVSPNSLTKYASVASWRAKSADDWNRRSGRKSAAISLTSLWKGSFLISSTDPFW